MPESRRVIDIREMGDDFRKALYAIDVRRYDLAIEILHQILSSKPENSMAFYTLGRIYTLKKQHTKALEALRETLRLDATNSYAHALYGAVLSEVDKGLYVSAEEEMRTAIRLDPSNPYTHYIYANFLLDRKKDNKQAREHCSKALELDPADVKYHWQSGRIHLAEGDVEQAEAAFRHGLSLDPEDALLHNSYGALLFNQRHCPQEAYEHFRIASMRKPDNPEYQKNLQLALRTKSGIYQFFWRYGLMRRKQGKINLLVTIALFLGLYICWKTAADMPIFMSVVLVILYGLSLDFIVYLALVNGKRRKRK